MRRVLIAVALTAGLMVTGVSPAPAITLKPDSCSTAGPEVVDVTLTVENLADLASDGHVWALDDYVEHVQVWRTGQKLYCVRREAVGTWVSFAGVSPAGTGTISAGLTGTLHGVRYLRLSGEFDPAYPTSGYIGVFDAQCGADGSCSGPEPRMSLLYFPRIYNIDFGWYDFVATSDADGTWHQSPDGDTGDITG
jgi:hypothetical protein